MSRDDYENPTAWNRTQRVLDARDDDLWHAEHAAEHRTEPDCPHCDVPDLADTLLGMARIRCEAARYPEQHPDDCAWCAHVLAVRGPL